MSLEGYPSLHNFMTKHALMRIGTWGMSESSFQLLMSRNERNFLPSSPNFFRFFYNFVVF